MAMRLSLIAKVPWTWDATNYESELIWTRVAPTALAACSPNKTASYSVSLLQDLKLSRKAIRVSSLEGAMRSTSTLLPPPPENPSTKTCQTTSDSLFPVEFNNSRLGNFARKSANACALIAILGWNCRSYSLSSIVHFTSHPEKSSLVKTLLSWLLMSIMMGWARK